MTQDEFHELINSEKFAVRERFRQALADLGHAEATCFSHWALEAYDMVHIPELRQQMSKSEY